MPSGCLSSLSKHLQNRLFPTKCLDLAANHRDNYKPGQRGRQCEELSSLQAFPASWSLPGGQSWVCLALGGLLRGASIIPGLAVHSNLESQGGSPQSAVPSLATWPQRPLEVQHLSLLTVMGLDVLKKKPHFSEGWGQKKDGHLILRTKHSNSQ